MTNLKVKQLTWVPYGSFGDTCYAKEFDIKISSNGIGWGLSPVDFPHFGNFEYKTLDEAKNAAQHEFEEYILSMFEDDGQ